MAAEFVTFRQGGTRIAVRRVDIEKVSEAATGDDDQRVSLTVAGKPVRVEETYDSILDLLND